jgi:putative FmdB family regulatory protein
MPIYAYRCTSCGHAKDVLQKVSDPVLTDCPACGAATFNKQVTAAGFQLKGSGWYVTDFRDGQGGAKKGEGAEAAKPDAGAEAKADSKVDAKSGAPSDSAKADGPKPEAKPATAAPAAPAPAPPAPSPAAPT